MFHQLSNSRRCADKRRSTLALLLPMVLLLWQGAQARPPQAVAPYARQYSAFAIQSCNRVEAKLPEITAIAEVMAKRHLAGGAIGFVGGYYEGSGLTSELEGRSGGLVNIGFDRVWTKDRTAEQKANDMAIVAWDDGPWTGDLEKIKTFKDAGTYIICFGSRAGAGMADRVAACDAWLDTGLFAGNGSGVVTVFGDRGFNTRAFGTTERQTPPVQAGRGNLLINMLNGWSLTAEFVAALTRQGKMPTMWKAFLYPDGREWANLYFQKKQFHDDYQIAPIPAGQLAKAYLSAMRTNITWFSMTQLPMVQKAADAIAAESAAGRQTIVATSSHAPPTYTGKYEDKVWAKALEVNSPEEIKATPDEALVLRLGYSGIGQKEIDVLAQKKQRVLFISSQNPLPGREIPKDLPVFIDMGFPFGDATVAIEGYPIKILPPSGIMQIVAYESVNVEVLARLARQPKPSTAIPGAAPAK